MTTLNFLSTVTTIDHRHIVYWTKVPYLFPFFFLAFNFGVTMLNVLFLQHNRLSKPCLSLRSYFCEISRWLEKLLFKGGFRYIATYFKLQLTAVLEYLDLIHFWVMNVCLLLHNYLALFPFLFCMYFYCQSKIVCCSFS